MKTNNEISVEILKKRIVKAIEIGYHDTKNIIPYCKAEFYYTYYCKAIAELQIEGVVEYISRKGYYLI